MYTQRGDKILWAPLVTQEGWTYLTEERNRLNDPNPDIHGDDAAKINHI
jgi:hypothetical protein